MDDPGAVPFCSGDSVMSFKALEKHFLVRSEV